MARKRERDLTSPGNNWMLKYWEEKQEKEIVDRFPTSLKVEAGVSGTSMFGIVSEGMFRVSKLEDNPDDPNYNPARDVPLHFPGLPADVEEYIKQNSKSLGQAKVLYDQYIYDVAMEGIRQKSSTARGVQLVGEMNLQFGAALALNKVALGAAVSGIGTVPRVIGAQAANLGINRATSEGQARNKMRDATKEEVVSDLMFAGIVGPLDAVVSAKAVAAGRIAREAKRVKNLDNVKTNDLTPEEFAAQQDANNALLSKQEADLVRNKDLLDIPVGNRGRWGSEIVPYNADELATGTIRTGRNEATAAADRGPLEFNEARPFTDSPDVLPTPKEEYLDFGFVGPVKASDKIKAGVRKTLGIDESTLVSRNPLLGDAKVRPDGKSFLDAIAPADTTPTFPKGMKPRDLTPKEQFAARVQSVRDTVAKMPNDMKSFLKYLQVEAMWEHSQGVVGQTGWLLRGSPEEIGSMLARNNLVKARDDAAKLVKEKSTNKEALAALKEADDALKQFDELVTKAQIEIPKDQQVKFKTNFDAEVPAVLKAAKPEYVKAGGRYVLAFDNDVDKALYMVANGKSNADGTYMEFLRKVFPDLSDNEIRIAGVRMVDEAIDWQVDQLHAWDQAKFSGSKDLKVERYFDSQVDPIGEAKRPTHVPVEGTRGSNGADLSTAIKVDETGELQGSWKALPKGYDKAEWKVATDNAEEVVTKADVNSPVMQTATAMVGGDLSKAKPKVIKRIVAQELYARQKAKQAGFADPKILGSLAVGGAVTTYALADPESFGELMETIGAGEGGALLAGLFFGPVGISRLAKARPGTFAKISEALEDAKSMDRLGRDVESIRKETGWWMSPDGHWRYELSTNEYAGNISKVDRNPNFKEFSAKREKQLTEMVDKVIQRPNNIAHLRKRLAEAGAPDINLNGSFVDIETRIKEVAAANEGTELGAKLNDVLFSLWKVYSSVDNQLPVRPSILDALGATKIRYLIEDAYPSTKHTALDDFNSKNSLEELEAPGTKAYFDRRTNKIGLSDALGFDERKSAAFHELSHKIDNEEGFPVGGTGRESAPGLSPKQAYMRQGGEAVARLVQRRLAYTAEEIAGRNPLEDLDVPANELIFKYDNGSELSLSAQFSDATVVQKLTPEESIEAAEKWAKENGAREMGFLTDTVDVQFFKVPLTGKVIGVPSEVRIPFTQYTVPTRIFQQMFERLGTSQSNGTRAISSRLLYTPTGRYGEDPLLGSAADVLSHMRAGNALGRATTVMREGQIAFFKKMGMSEWSDEANELFNRQVIDAQRGKTDVDEIAIKVADELYKIHVDMHNQAGRMLKGMGLTVDQLPKDSLMRKFLEIKPTKGYVHRMPNYRAIRELIATHGEDAVVKLLAKAIGNANTSMKEGQTMVAAREYLASIRKRPSSAGPQGTGVFDREGSIQRLVDTGRSPEEAAKIVDDLQMSEIQPGIFQERVNLDELATLTVNGKQLSVSSLFVTDPMYTMGSWIHPVSGIMGLFESFSKWGIDATSAKGWQTIVDAGKADGMVDEELEMINTIRDKLLGRGDTTDLFGQETALGKAVRSLVTIRFGAWFPFAQLADTGNQIYAQSVKSMFTHFPVLGRYRTGFLDGTMTRQSTMDLAAACGFGLDHTMPSFIAAVDGGTDPTAFRKIAMATHKTFTYNGFYAIIDATKEMVTRSAIQRIIDESVHGKAVDQMQWKHWEAMGYSHKQLQEMAPVLKRVVKLDEHGLYDGIDWKLAEELNFTGTSDLQQFLYRLAKDASSESAGLATTVPWMTGELGRFATQFQGVALHGWNRFRRDAHNFDPIVMQRWFMGMFMASIAYMARTKLSYGNDPEEMEKRMTYEEIAKAAFRNSAISGYAPLGIETAWRAVTGEALFSNQTNRGMGTYAWPVFAAGNSTFDAFAGATSSLAPDDNWTMNERRKLLDPLAPTWYLRTAENFYLRNFPVNDKDTDE